MLNTLTRKMQYIMSYSRTMAAEVNDTQLVKWSKRHRLKCGKNDTIDKVIGGHFCTIRARTYFFFERFSWPAYAHSTGSDTERHPSANHVARACLSHPPVRHNFCIRGSRLLTIVFLLPIRNQLSAWFSYGFQCTWSVQGLGALEPKGCDIWPWKHCTCTETEWRVSDFLRERERERERESYFDE